MPERRLTFKSGTVSRFIQKHGIGLRFREVPSASEYKREYIITLTRPEGLFGKFRTVTLPYIAGIGLPHSPELERIIWHVGRDLLHYHYAKDDPHFIALNYGSNPERSYEIFASLQDMAEEFTCFLGPEAYDELVDTMMREEE